MKKILMIVPFALAASKSFSVPFELTASTSFDIPVDDDKKMVRDISAIKYNCGIRLNFDATVLAGNARLSSKKFMDFAGCNARDLTSMQQYTIGARHTRELGILKADLFAGNLKYSSCISRLKSPTINCPSPQKNQVLPVSGIGPSLPTPSSSKAVFSYAAILSPQTTKVPLPAFQVALLDSGEKYFSISKRLECHFIPEILLSCTAGTFFHEYKKETGWFQNERYYNESEYLSTENSITFLWKTFKTTASVGLYENPFGGTRRWFRNHSILYMGFYSLGLNFFDADEDIITASGNMPRTGRQIFLTQRFNFKLGKGITAIGATIGQSMRKTNKRLSWPYSVYDMKVGLSHTTMKVKLKGNYDYEYSTENMKAKKFFGLGAEIGFTQLKANTAFTASIPNENSRTYRITEKITFKKKILDDASLSWSWTEGKEKNKWNLDAGIGLSKATKKILIKGKLNVSFQKAS